MFSQQPHSKSPLAIIEEFLWKIDQIDKWEDNLNKIQRKLDDIVFYYIKQLPHHEKARMINKLEPYTEKFSLVFKDFSVRAFSMHAWLLEMKMEFCDKKEHDILLKKTEGIYKEFLKKHKNHGFWFVRLNYLGFSSKHLHPDETLKLASSFLDQHFEFMPTQKQLAKIKTIVAIEYEKLGQPKKYIDYAFQAKSHDPKYAPPYSLIGKYYCEQANQFYSLKKFDKAEYYMQEAERYFEKARLLDPARFEKKHGAPPASSTKIIFCDLIERENDVNNTSSRQKINLKKTSWPVLLSSAAEEKLRKEFKEKFPMAAIKPVDYSAWEKENAEALLRESKIKYLIQPRPKISAQTSAEAMQKKADSPSLLFSNEKLNPKAASFEPGKAKVNSLSR